MPQDSHAGLCSSPSRTLVVAQSSVDDLSRVAVVTSSSIVARSHVVVVSRASHGSRRVIVVASLSTVVGRSHIEDTLFLAVESRVRTSPSSLESSSSLITIILCSELRLGLESMSGSESRSELGSLDKDVEKGSIWPADHSSTM